DHRLDVLYLAHLIFGLEAEIFTAYFAGQQDHAVVGRRADVSGIGQRFAQTRRRLELDGLVFQLGAGRAPVRGHHGPAEGRAQDQRGAAPQGAEGSRQQQAASEGARGAQIEQLGHATSPNKRVSTVSHRACTASQPTAHSRAGWAPGSGTHTSVSRNRGPSTLAPSPVKTTRVKSSSRAASVAATRVGSSRSSEKASQMSPGLPRARTCATRPSSLKASAANGGRSRARPFTSRFALCRASHCASAWPAHSTLPPAVSPWVMA